MDAWLNTGAAIESLAGNGASLPSILNYSDPLLSQVLTVKKGLQIALEANLDESMDGEVTGKGLIQTLNACVDGDLVTLESILRNNPEVVQQLYPSEEHGVTPLIFAICFNNPLIVDSLLSSHDVDPNQNDTLVNYTPLMWAVHFKQLDIVEILLNYQADPYLSPGKDTKKNAVSLASLGSGEIYEYFKSHNLLDKPVNDGQEIFYKEFEPVDHMVDDFETRLKLQSMTSGNIEEDEKEEVVLEEDDEDFLSQDPLIDSLPTFVYEKLLPEQYIKFTDSDIPSLLDFIFTLRINKPQFQHDSKVPAATLFQLIRYSHLKVSSDELTEFLFECFTARLRSVTNTKSGVFNMATQTNSTNQNNTTPAGDIVSLSYWLSVIQFLHFYFCKNDIYRSYPKFLQELINLVQSLIATLSFSINSRLNTLVDDCLLNFTNLVDVSNVLYAKDWNLFKSKKHPSTYDDILTMLYPPTPNELMRPSPIRYIQVLGALDYVLKIHKVDSLLTSQAFSQVFYYADCTIFNRIISQSKYCSRAKAIQIRLNISTIEDWLRSHNYKSHTPDKIGGLNELLGDAEVKLHNLIGEGRVQISVDDEAEDVRNPHKLKFYYNSLYQIGKCQLQPTIELLQWLQCMSLVADEESLVNTINQFDSLNYYQLFKVVNKLYKYEVDEKKIPKPLANFIKTLMIQQGEKQISRLYLHYMTQSTFLSKEIYIYLNPNYVFEVVLPNSNELISKYGAGIGGVRILRSKKYQPSLPIAIVDDIDDILTENKNGNLNETYEYENEDEDEDEEAENGHSATNGLHVKSSEFKSTDFKGDELFKQVQLPNSLVHKEWGDENYEDNPW